MNNEPPGQDFNRRHSDAIVVALSQKFYDFIERYDRDVGALNQWRTMIDAQLKLQDGILREISPAYNRGLWVIGIVILGTISLAVVKFWSHVSFNGK